MFECLIDMNKEDEQYDVPEFKPRKASKRSLSQWMIWLKYKTGYYKLFGCIYGCPVCGENHDDSYPSNTMLEMTRPEYDACMSYNWGGEQTTWDETHQCNECGEVYSFSNGSI